MLSVVLFRASSGGLRLFSFQKKACINFILYGNMARFSYGILYRNYARKYGQLYTPKRRKGKVNAGISNLKATFVVHKTNSKLVASKFIFVTGGVTSSLGKGIISASLAKLLQARGFSVTIQKFDPYNNIDPGTLNPYEHG